MKVKFISDTYGNNYQLPENANLETFQEEAMIEASYSLGSKYGVNYISAVYQDDYYYIIIPEGYVAETLTPATIEEKGGKFLNLYTDKTADIIESGENNYGEKFGNFPNCLVYFHPIKKENNSYAFTVSDEKEVDFERILSENPQQNIFVVTYQDRYHIIARNEFRSKFIGSDNLLLGNVKIRENWGYYTCGKDARKNVYFTSEIELSTLLEQIEKILNFKRKIKVEVKVF